MKLTDKHIAEIQRFKQYHGYEPDLENPKTFSEKIEFKKFFDHNPLLTLTADKFRARDYIRDRIGWKAENHLIPLYWVGKNPYDIPWDKLPNDYIIKPNNGAGRWILKETHFQNYYGDILNPQDTPWIVTKYSIGKQPPRLNVTNGELIIVIKNWFKTIHGQEWFEWCYQDIDPLIIIEKVLFGKDDLALDYKVFTFNGEPKIVQVLDRNDVHMTYYDIDWNQIKVSRKHHPLGEPVAKPKNLDQMLEFSKNLSEPFEFVRCDFYTVDDYVYFGEITHYPSSGHGVFEPENFDLELGNMWKLDKEYYKLWEK